MWTVDQTKDFMEMDKVVSAWFPCFDPSYDFVRVTCGFQIPCQ